MRIPERSLRRWAVATGMLLALFAGLLAREVAGNLVACRADLQVVPEPADWREWPRRPDLGGYRIEGRSMMAKYPLGMEETELRDDGLCPRGGISLDAWFTNGPEPSYMRTTSEVSLRGSGEIRVVSAVRGDVSSASAGETFIAAFRRVSGWRLRFVSPRAAGFAAAFGVGLVALLATAIAARKAIASARSYLDTSLYKPGTRDASGSVVFDDGSPPLATPSETNASHLATGRVLVRVSGATAGSYRVAPSTSAVRVLVGDAESLARDAREVARTRLSTACWCAVAFLAAIAATALYLAFGDATRDML